MRKNFIALTSLLAALFIATVVVMAAGVTTINNSIHMTDSTGAEVLSTDLPAGTTIGGVTISTATGDVAGPGSATDLAIALFDGTTGKLIKNSTVKISSTGILTVPENLMPGSPPASNTANIVLRGLDHHLLTQDEDGIQTDYSEGGWITAQVSGSPATTTSTTLVDITGLSCAAKANTSYELEGVLWVSTSATATGEKYGIQFSAAGASLPNGVLVQGISSTTSASLSALKALNTATANTYLTANSEVGMIYMRGRIDIGANAGNVTLQHLKVTSGTSTVAVKSRLRIREL